MERGPRRSLILAGGGIRVAWQAGVLLALEEAGLTFDHVDGTSGGTINLAMMLSGLDARAMCGRWQTFEVRDMISPLPLASYFEAGDVMSLGDADRLVGRALPSLGIDIDRIRGASGVDGTFNVCNFTRKTVEVIPHRDLSIELLVAGISLPIFLPPVTWQGCQYTDAVWIRDANLMEAVRRGAEEVWLLWCIGNTPPYHAGMFRQYVHMIEMSANGALFEEFDRIRELNGRIARGDSPYGQKRPIRVHIIRPEHALPLDPDLFFGRVTTGTLLAMGHADAQRYLAIRQDEGVPLDPEATHMSEAQPGVTFRETMTGPFALGPGNPRDGFDAGRQGATELAMHATVSIRDMDRFIQDPAHLGELQGTIDFPPLGTGIQALSGVFNLFSPAGTPRLKLMVYELGFRHGNADYYLAGKKEVRDDPGPDLWKDTTTLYTQLHSGRDTTGPVIGSGILSLSVIDLVKLTSTFRVTNASSTTDRAAVAAKFGRFFLGELWDSYARHLHVNDEEAAQ